MAADLGSMEKDFGHRTPAPLGGQRPFLPLIYIAVAFLAATSGAIFLGWILGLPQLLSPASGNVPMAPSTAALFLLHAGAIFFRLRFPDSGAALRTSLTATAAGAAAALLFLALSAQGVHLETEHPGIPIPHPAGEPLLGHMSPATALCFLLASLSFLFSPASPAQHPRRAWTAVVFAFLLAASGFVFSLAYAYGAPLLYGTSYIPPAALTSLNFMLLGAALIALALPPAWLARLHGESSPSVLRTFILIFSFLAATIIVAGFLTFRNHERNRRAEVERQLSAIGELKANDLAQYRMERKEDAALLFANASFIDLVRRHLNNHDDHQATRQLLEWLNKLHAHYQYDQTRLLDHDGKTLLSIPADQSPVSTTIAQRLPEVLRTGKVTIQDFYRQDDTGKIFLAVLIPILDPQNNNQPLGIISLRIDPEQYLYPFLQRWPVPSRTAETLLVRREGEEVVFLNDLRFLKDAALTLRFPLSRTDLPAARAVLNQTGTAEGRDYRDLPVIADVRPIPDSPWFLVSKINTTEAFAPMREHLWFMGGFITLLLSGLGAIMAIVWQRQKLAFLRDRLETAAALKNLNRVYAVLGNINQTIVRVRDPKTMLEAACRIAVEDGGFQMAWIGMVDQPSGTIIPQARAGRDEGYVDMLCNGQGNLSVAGCLTGEAIRESRHSVANDIQRDTRMAPWQTEARQRGYRSAAAFPIIVLDKVWGTLSLYAKEKNFFSAEEIKLLDELVMDISFALEFFEQEQRRIQSEAALRESQQLLATVADTSPALIWMSGLDKGCFWFNKPWLAFTGRSLEQELGDGWTAGVHPDELAYCLQVYTGAFEARQPFAMEYRLRRHDGEYRWLLDQGHPRYDASGSFAGFIGSCLDITEHRNLEKQMRHAVKMESIGTLAGGVAHDFNNILMAIIGYGQLALMGIDPNDPQRQNIQQMLAGADRAARLTRDLLLFSRKQITERQPVDLNAIVRIVEKFITRVIGEDIACETRLSSEPLIVLADSHQLEQVLMNFATNARDAMPRGGVFTITTETTVLNQDFVAAHGFGRPGSYALLTASDTGFGMDETTRSRIFEPFFTTKGVGKGTGLGLAVAYGIVKQHEGYINVYSEPGRGATFRLYLPLIVDEDTLQDAISKEEEVPAHGTETILLAEDDDSLRILAKTALTRFGYTVIEAADGEEAVRKFEENQSAVQLLLFDIIMPKMNGRDAYDTIRTIRPGVKAIFMSGYAPDMVREKAELENSAPVLSKPLSPTALLGKVRETLDKP